MASVFKNMVVVERGLYEEILLRLARTCRLAQELRSQRDEEHQLLIVALTELAVERGSTDRQHFARKWLREMRGEPERLRAAREHKTLQAKQRRARRNGHH